MFTDRGPVTVNRHTGMMLKNVNIYSCWGHEVECCLQGLPFLEKREVPFEKLTSPVLPLSRAKDAIEAILQKDYRLEGRETIFKSALDPWME